MMNAYGQTDALNAPPGGVATEAAQIGRLSVWICIGWLSTFVVEGPLRGALATLGLANLLYARDLVPLLSVLMAFALPLTRGTRHAPGLVIAGWLLALHWCIGMLLPSGTPFERLFGVKIFMPLIYTIAIYPAVASNFRLFTKALIAFFVISVVGVFVNEVLGEMPWDGMNYDTAFGVVDTTRQWWMSGGVRRLQGLARASFDAAMIIGLCGVVMLAIAQKRWVRLLVVVAAGYAIVLTTSKGMVVAFGIATLWLALCNRSVTSLKSGRLVVVALLLLTCLVPTIFMLVKVSENPADIPPLLSSLWDRFSWMWPAAYSLLPDGYGALTGNGLGGIGTAVDMNPTPSSADSVFVYYFVTFGLAGIAYLAFPLVAVLGRKAPNDPRSFIWAGLLIVAYGYGLSINMVEQAFFAGLFGLVYGRAFEVWSQKDSFA